MTDKAKENSDFVSHLKGCLFTNANSLALLYDERVTKKKSQTAFLKQFGFHFVGIPGFEPGMTGPESVVLPLHHIPLLQAVSLIASAKVRLFCEPPKKNGRNFIKKHKIFVLMAFSCPQIQNNHYLCRKNKESDRYCRGVREE